MSYLTSMINGRYFDPQMTATVRKYTFFPTPQMNVFLWHLTKKFSSITCFINLISVVTFSSRCSHDCFCSWSNENKSVIESLAFFGTSFIQFRLTFDFKQILMRRYCAVYFCIVVALHLLCMLDNYI